MTDLSPITIVFGPTASGKTAFAHQLAHSGADILSADARQIYTHMDVVTGKDIPTSAKKTSQPHPFLGSIPVWELSNGSQLYGHDIVEPNSEFSISHWYQVAAPIITKHLNQERPLIIVGGSWPHISVLFDPPESLFIPPNLELREQATEWSTQQLQAALQQADALAWLRLNSSDQQNPRRLIRALEVSLAQHDPMVSPPLTLFTPKLVTLFTPDLSIDALEVNIAERVTHRWSNGALHETHFLIDIFPHWEYPAFSSTGYGLIRQHLLGELTETETQQRWIQQERQYAKRQLTWLKALPIKYPDLWARQEIF